MKKLIIILTAVLCGYQYAGAWGRTGHDAIAYIAERNLTPKAKKTIEKYLDNHSIVYYASWMDQYRKTPGYEKTSTWHSGSVDADLRNTDEVRSPKGDAVAELENAIARLKNYRELDDSTVNVNLKYIIHLVGDMHCPSHVKYTGKDVKKIKRVILNGKKVSYHSVWDSGALAGNHAWGYTEYGHQLDRLSKKEQKAITAGTPKDWFEETARDCKGIYEMTEEGGEIGKDFINQSRHLVDSQVTKAGYRLAKVLNDLF
ncbi:MAG: S1/P1 nuclease [Alistipes sp.]|nr:S1/P1 nuclease [Alistipes sp.]